MPFRRRKNLFLHRLMYWLLPMAAALGINACATLEQMIQKPTVTFGGMRLTNADLIQGTAVFDFNISNPNPINIRASRITYDLKLNGRNFVSGQLDQGITLAAGGTSVLQVPIHMAYLDFFNSVTQLLRTKSADYALTGGFNVGPFAIPFQAHGTFELPKMPRISLESIEIRKLSLIGATLNGRLKLDNSNGFDLLFKRMDYTLNLGGTSFGRASALPQGAISKNSNSVVEFAFDVSFAQLGHSAYQLLQGTKTDYSLDGGFILEQQDHRERKVPFKLSGQVPFLR